MYQSGKDAVADALVGDIRLPDDDGYALVRELRAIDRLRSVQAIAVTDCAGDAEEQFLSAGYDVRLAKPVDPGKLIAALSAAIRPRQPNVA
jgi:two-component system CheB/CheR fusion protein